MNYHINQKKKKGKKKREEKSTDAVKYINYNSTAYGASCAYHADCVALSYSPFLMYETYMHWTI